MVTIVLALLGLCPAHQEVRYDSSLIPSPPQLETLSDALILDDGIVVCNWYRWVSPGHGASGASKPFVWNGKENRALPLGTAEFGHINHGRTGCLVGDVMTKDGPLPAMWTPDRAKGWAQPKLTILDHRKGRAVWVSRVGVVWITSETAVTRWEKGRFERTSVESFDLVAVADDGRWFGNKFSSIGLGGSRDNSKACVYQTGRWTELPASDSRITRLEAVNDSGIATGSAIGKRWQAVMWDATGIHVLPGSEGQYASAEAINDAGQIVGTKTTEGKWAACLWESGKITELGMAASGVSPQQAISINSRGQILAVLERRQDEFRGLTIYTDLHLLSPRK